MSTQHSASERNMSARLFRTWPSRMLHLCSGIGAVAAGGRPLLGGVLARTTALAALVRGTPVVVPALSILRSGNTGANEHYSCATTTSLRIPRRGAQRGYRTLRAWLTSGSGARPRRRASSASSLRLAPCTTTSRAQWRMALWSTPSLPLPTLSEVRACLGAFQ